MARRIEDVYSHQLVRLTRQWSDLAILRGSRRCRLAFGHHRVISIEQHPCPTTLFQTTDDLEVNDVVLSRFRVPDGVRLLPVCAAPSIAVFAQMTLRRPTGKILGLNAWLRTYAKASGSLYLDYYSAHATGRFMRREFTVDGFLPNDAGYAVMEPWPNKRSWQR